LTTSSTRNAGEIWTDEDWQMDITDETGLILFIIIVNVLRSPATAQNNK